MSTYHWVYQRRYVVICVIDVFPVEDDDIVGTLSVHG